MSINPLSLGISSNFTVSSSSAGCAQTTGAADASTAAGQDSVQLSAENNSPNVSSGREPYSPASAADKPRQAPASGSAEPTKKNAANKDKSSVSKKDSAAPSKRTRAKKTVSEQELKDKAAFQEAHEGGSRDFAVLSSYLDKDVGRCKSIKGTEGDDTILISTNANGSLTITVNDQDSLVFPREAKPRLIIDGRKGNDTIIVDSKVAVPLNITGGEGDDYIVGGSGDDVIVDNAGANTIYGGAGRDRIVAHGVNLPTGGKGSTIYGGEGRDYIEGGNANDIIFGGEGDEVIYGVGGGDEIHGGAGHDYLDGGEGNDTILGEEGDDNIIGGKGSDKLEGGAGDDLLIGASGSDTITGGDGADKAISSGLEDSISTDGADTPVQTVSSMEIPDSFRIGDLGNLDSPQDRDRINSDMETLAHIAPGQKMFTEIAATGHTVRIQRDLDRKGSFCFSSSAARSAPGVGANSIIHYENAKISAYDYMKKSDSIKDSWYEFVPIVLLYHEMCHSYNAATGTMDTHMYTSKGPAEQADMLFATPGAEYQAMGIDVPGLQANDPMLTENGLRDVFGLQRRDFY